MDHEANGFLQFSEPRKPENLEDVMNEWLDTLVCMQNDIECSFLFFTRLLFRILNWCYFTIFYSGRRAVDALIADGRRLARQLPPGEQQELEETITEVQMLTEQLATLKAKGKVGINPIQCRAFRKKTEDLDS